MCEDPYINKCAGVIYISGSEKKKEAGRTIEDAARNEKYTYGLKKRNP